MICGILAQAASMALIPNRLAADSPSGGLVLQVSSETAPPDGSVQFKVSVTSPALIATGNISMEFDPATFGNVASVSVFSATGDQIGYSNVRGQHVDAHFSSTSGGIGQLPGLPVFVVSVPVLATATPGAIAQVTVDPTVDPTGVGWTDPNGNSYTVTVSPAKFTVGGSLSVVSVTPRGGLLPQGTIVAITGTGFQAATSVSIDGVAISSVQYIGPQQISFPLGGPTELTGKRVRVTNTNGAFVDYFSALPSASAIPPSGFTTIPNVHPILPLAGYTNTEMFGYAEHAPGPVGYALLNPSVAPVTVSFEGAVVSVRPPDIILTETITIPPGALYFLDAASPLLSGAGNFGEALWITAPAPIRMTIWEVPYSFGFPNNNPPVVSPPPLSPGNPPPQVQVDVVPLTVSWSWQVGTPPPSSTSFRVLGNTNFNVTIPSAAAAWLSASPSTGTPPATVALTPNLVGLSPGTYNATVTVTPVVPSSLVGITAQSSMVTVSVTVTAAPLLTVSAPFCCGFFAPGSNGSSPPQTLTVSTNGNPAPFTVSVIPGTGGNWLTVTPLSGTTPVTLTISANPAGLADGQYSSQIVLSGPMNTVTIPVGLEILSPPPPPPPPGIQVSPAALSFALNAGSGPSTVPQVVTIHPNGIAFTATTQSGGDWLSTALFVNDVQTIIPVNASAVGLSAGTYQGTLTITLGMFNPVVVTVTLTVLPAPTAQTMLTATPSTVSLSVPVGQFVSQTVVLGSAGAPILFSLSVDSLGVADWLQPLFLNSSLKEADGQVATPATISVDVNASNLLPGTYHHHFVLTWATGSLTIPLTLSVTANASLPPIVAAVVDAASATAGALAPGEIIEIFGTGIGPAPTGLILDASGKVATILGGAHRPR
jgi:hypothetical protein